MRFRRTAPLLALAVCFHVSAAAQTQPAHRLSAHAVDVPEADPAVQSGRRFWIGLGAGASTAGLTGEVDASLLAGPQLFRFRFTGHNAVGTAGTGNPIPMSEVALMYGRGTWMRNGNWLSAAAGPGLVTGRSTPDPTQDFQTLGLSLELQLITRRRPKIALTGIANANPSQSMAGVTITLILGEAP